MGLDMSFYKLGGVKSISSTGEIETDEKKALSGSLLPIYP